MRSRFSLAARYSPRCSSRTFLFMYYLLGIMNVFPRKHEHSETEGPSLLQGFVVLALIATTTSPTPCTASERTSALSLISFLTWGIQDRTGPPTFLLLSFIRAAPATPGDGWRCTCLLASLPLPAFASRRAARHPHFPDTSGTTFTALHLGSLSYGPHFA